MKKYMIDELIKREKEANKGIYISYLEKEYEELEKSKLRDLKKIEKISLDLKKLNDVLESNELSLKRENLKQQLSYLLEFMPTYDEVIRKIELEINALEPNKEKRIKNNGLLSEETNELRIKSNEKIIKLITLKSVSDYASLYNLTTDEAKGIMLEVYKEKGTSKTYSRKQIGA